MPTATLRRCARGGSPPQQLGPARNPPSLHTARPPTKGSGCIHPSINQWFGFHPSMQRGFGLCPSAQQGFGSYPFEGIFPSQTDGTRTRNASMDESRTQHAPMNGARAVNRRRARYRPQSLLAGKAEARAAKMLTGRTEARALRTLTGRTDARAWQAERKPRPRKSPRRTTGPVSPTRSESAPPASNRNIIRTESGHVPILSGHVLILSR